MIDKTFVQEIVTNAQPIVLDIGGKQYSSRQVFNAPLPTEPPSPAPKPPEPPNPNPGEPAPIPKDRGRTTALRPAPYPGLPLVPARMGEGDFRSATSDLRSQKFQILDSKIQNWTQNRRGCANKNVTAPNGLEKTNC